MDFSSSQHPSEPENERRLATNQAAAEMEALLRGLEIQPNTQRDVRESIFVPPESRFSYAWFFLVFWLTLIATIILSWQMIL